MKILHAVHNFPPEFVGGTEAYLSGLVERQVRNGLEVVVVTGSEAPGRDPAEEQWAGCRVVRLHHDSSTERYSVHFQIPRLMVEYSRVLAQEQPDLVHVHHYLNLGIPLVGLATTHGIPAVVTLHDFTAACPRFFLIRPDGEFCGDAGPLTDERCFNCCQEEYDGSDAALAREFRLRRAFFEEELSLASRILVPSEKAAGYLKGTRLFPESFEFLALPLGMPHQFSPSARVEAPGRVRLVLFGNLAPVKGIELLFEALAGLAPDSLGRISLLLLGACTDPALAARIGEGVPGLDLRHEPGFDRRRLERLPEEADLAVFPGTAAETYSLVVDEALALGLPVIVSDRGAAADRAGEAGIVVRTGDVLHLRQAIESVLTNPDLLDRLRTRIPREPATLEEHARRLEEIYRSVSDRGPSSPRPGEKAAPALEFDPGFTFPPLLEFAAVPGGHVVVLAPHPDDEVIGPGGALALHTARGDRLTVVHLTDGGSGDRENLAQGKITSVRKQEARAAGEILGVTRFESLDFPDGGLRPEGAFLAGLAGLLDSLAPDVLYAPSPFEHHPDHRATVQLVAAMASRLNPALPVILYEVNEPQPASFLLDITPVLDKKRDALRQFASQRVYLDVAENTLAVNRARTSNVDLEAVEAVEAFVQVGAGRLQEWLRQVAGLRKVMRNVTTAAEAPSLMEKPLTPTVPVSAVISTWNKNAGVRENLLALARQSKRPAEIIVVDNASTDGTPEMIRTEFPEVRLIEMPHDKKGACETFNIGFKAVTQPFTAIMDDDVAAPPNWLETLFERIGREPETTAMVSSKVVEPGMPEEFLNSAAVNRERYMATFRGCGTLARTDVLKAAGYYDEKFFIYGNERDLSARVLSLGYRILQCPQAEIFHKTPFGMKAGKRSLYFHVRNFWLYAFKNCTWRQVIRAGWVLGLKGLGVGRKSGFSSDATGTIGIDRAVKDVDGGLWIVFKASLAALALLPYCLKHRQVCRAEDFEPPVM
ncbi:MAG: PIG-L family deacetylase [Planctomycetota bacterium]